MGNSQIAPLESGLTDSLNRLTVPRGGVGSDHRARAHGLPNPYRVEARWDQAS
jgi:hypothetical protein